MKKLLQLFLLFTAVSAHAYTATVYNFAPSVRTYRDVWANMVVNVPAYNPANNPPYGQKTSTAGLDGSESFPIVKVYTVSGLGTVISPTGGNYLTSDSQSAVWIDFYTNTCVEITKTIGVTNTTMQKKIYVVKLNGAEVETGGLFGADTTIPSGNIFTRTVDINVCTNGATDVWEVYMKEYYATLVDDTVVQTNREVLTYSTQGGTNNFPSGNNSNNSTNAMATWQTQTNATINFTGTSSTAAKDDTLKAGFNVLAQKLDKIDTTLNLNQAMGTGESGGSGDNTEVVNAIDIFRNANTNLLGQINDKLGQTNFSFQGSSTNAASALAQAEEQMSGPNESASDVLTELGSAPSILGGGSADVLSFEFMGQTLNLDPDVRFPGAASFFKSGIMLLVALWLGRYLVELYLKTAAIYASSETGGVPAVGPWGSVGLVIAVLVSIGVVGLWVLVFTAIFTYGLNYLSTVNDTVAGFSTANAGALYLINLFFPITFIMSAAWTRMVAPFSVAKIVIITASAQRFMLGK